MIDIAIPGRDPLHLKYLVLDMNGTLALDGQLLSGVRERLELLSAQLEIWLISADTYGTLSTIAPTLKVTLRRMEPQAGTAQKGALVEELGATEVTAIGNGANDVDMLRRAALGIAVLGPEGLAAACLNHFGVVFSHSWSRGVVM